MSRKRKSKASVVAQTDEQRAVAEELIGVAHKCRKYLYFKLKIDYGLSELDFEDLFQDLVERLLTTKALFVDNRGRNAITWLLVVMRSIAINDYRRRCNRRVELYDPTDSVVPDMNSEAWTSKELSADYLTDATLWRSALANVAKDKSTGPAMTLRMMGYDYEQIAKEIDVPLGTVRSKLFRARHKIVEAGLATEKGMLTF